VVLFHDPNRTGPGDVPYPAFIKIADGRPSNPEQGLRFIVRRNSTIRGRVAALSDPDRYTEVTVLAYSERGELLMNSSLSAGTKTAAP